MVVAIPRNKHFHALEMQMQRDHYWDCDAYGNPIRRDAGSSAASSSIKLSEVVVQVGGQLAIVDLELTLHGKQEMMAVLDQLNKKSKDGFEFSISIKVPDDHKLIKHNIEKNLRLQNMVIDGDDTSLIGGI